MGPNLLCSKDFNRCSNSLSYSHSLVVEPSPSVEPSQTDAPEEDHTLSNKRRRHVEPAAPLPVAVVIVFRSLGQLLPERYDPDRRSLR